MVHVSFVRRACANAAGRGTQYGRDGMGWDAGWIGLDAAEAHRGEQRDKDEHLQTARRVGAQLPGRSGRKPDCAALVIVPRAARVSRARCVHAAEHRCSRLRRARVALDGDTPQVARDVHHRSFGPEGGVGYIILEPGTDETAWQESMTRAKSLMDAHIPVSRLQNRGTRRDSEATDDQARDGNDGDDDVDDHEWPPALPAKPKVPGLA